MRLRSGATGLLVRGRCGATNKCSYCAKLGSIELAEMLSLDATEHFGPEVWMCLGTRTPELDPRPFYRAREQVQKALRRRWDAEVANIREFTTGYGPRSGGLRRPHWNMLLKGVPGADLEQLHEVASRVWCQHVDAEPERQYAGLIHEAGGLSRYLGLHFQKESQAPPKGWRGHRFTSSRGYFPEGVKVARERARASIRLRRQVWWLERQCAERGVELDAAEIDELARQLAAATAAERWELAHVLPESQDVDRRRLEGALAPFKRKGGTRCGSKGR